MKKALKKFPLVRRLAARTRDLRRRVRRTARRVPTHVAGLMHPARPSAATPSAGAPQQLTADLARVEWRDQGATAHLVERARSLAANSVAWNLMPPRLWVVFCGALLEAGDLSAAEHIVRTSLIRGMPSSAFAECLPVARFARDLGVRDVAVDQAAYAADVLDANTAHQVFAELVVGKTVAVVGNGPGCLDTGVGAEIDEHDIVVRFNNYPTGFADDYGARTDIWVRGAHRDVRDRADIERYKLVVWEMDLFRNLLEVPAHRGILYRDTLLSPNLVTHIDTGTKQRLRAASGLLLPTSGAQLLWMLHEARGSLSGVDVYGFSTLDGSDDHGHFFDKLGDMDARHDVSGEGRFLRELLADSPIVGVKAEDDAPIVFSSAYRDYDLAAGKTGGPGGVLATQRHALGDSRHGAELVYAFRSDDPDLSQRELSPAIDGLSAKVADIVLASEFIAGEPRLLAAQASGRPTLIVCHDLGSAYGAHRLGLPYVVIYHQQGSTLQEMRSIGRVPTPHETHVAHLLERTILDHAQQVYFPSLGARDTYLATSDAGVDGGNFAGWALYNTVSAADHANSDTDTEATIDELRRALRLPAKTADTAVFVSVGDFNEDKGLDRIPALLTRYAAVSGRQIIWVAIGAASDQDRFEALRQESKSWPFQSRIVGERMTHDKLLALLDYADYYVMMHRRSIFDLATLEAMRAGTALILSPVGGNVEVDLDGNVLFVTEETIDDAARVIQLRDPAEWGRRNRAVFDRHFSLGQFTERYGRMLDEQLGAAADVAPVGASAVALMKRALWITCGVRGNAGDALLHEVTPRLFDGLIDLDFRHVSDPVYLRRGDTPTDNVIIGPGGLFVQTNSSRHLHSKLAKQWDRFESKRFFLWSTGVLQEPSDQELAAVRRVTSRAPKIVVRANKEAEMLRDIGPVTSPAWAPCASLFTDRLLDATNPTADVVVVNFDSSLFTDENIADHPLRRFRDAARAEGLDVRSMVNAAGDSNRMMLDLFPLIDIDQRPFGKITDRELEGRPFHDAFNKALRAHPSFAERYTHCRFAFGKRLHAWLPFLAYDRPAAFIGMQARRGMPRDYFGDDEFLCAVPRKSHMSTADLDRMADAMITKLRTFIRNEDALTARIAERRAELWGGLQGQAREFATALS